VRKLHGRGSFDRAVRTEPLAFAANAVRSMGFEFGFAGQRAVLLQQAMADKAVQLGLAVATISLGETVGAHPRT